MNLDACDILVIGAGPGGLSAAIEAAEHGASVLIVDGNAQAGGQLVKQTHKFFGSERHYAGMRGVDIAKILIKKLPDRCHLQLNAPVVGIFDGLVVMAVNREVLAALRPKRIVIATGAVENTIYFPGWTLPGVMTAGAAQTFVNVHRVRVGDKILVVGSGNVGLIVAYQLCQAGCTVMGVVEIMPHIGGWKVHADKLKRMGIPFYLSHTIKEARGEERVCAAIIQEVDDSLNPVIGTEKELPVDTICLAVGMAPEIRLVEMLGASLVYESWLGGWVPIHNEVMETTVSGVFVAGDAAGIEEASTAMEEGRLAGLAAAYSLGYLSENDYAERRSAYHLMLSELRSGPFGSPRKEAKDHIVRSYYEYFKQSKP